MTWRLLSCGDCAKERVATTHQINNDRDAGKYMTGSRRMQGIITFATLRTQYAHWFGQRRKGRKDSPQFQEGDYGGVQMRVPYRRSRHFPVQAIATRSRSILGFPNPRIAHGGVDL